MGTIDGNMKHARTNKKRERASEPTPNQEHSVSDPRFVAAETDPRFARVPKRAKRAVIDTRFKQKLRQDPGFRESDTPVDRFGRPRHTHHLHESLKNALIEGEQTDSESDQDIHDSLRPTVTSGLDVESDSDDSDIAQFLEEQEQQVPELIPRGKATRRLAVIALDWSTTRAVDIYTCLHSFCPPGKTVTSVEVHPSKFGLERLAAEAKFGPQVMATDDMKVVEDAKKQNLPHQQRTSNVSLEKNGLPKEHDDDLDSQSEEHISDSDNDGIEEKRWKEQAALRKYEEERLKYYYAVVEFDDVKAADAVYEQCDGVEFAQSGRAFDLRFVPDDMKIQTTPRDRAESVPDGYMPPNVAPSSLNSSTVKLSWDADDPHRVILKKKAIGKQQLDEENLKAYLGSASEDEGVTGSARDIERKRNLLLGSQEKEAGEESDQGMEITFEPGMLEKAEDIVKRKQAKDQHHEETHWEARLRRLQERKAEKRRKRREQLDALKPNGENASGDENADEDGNNNDASRFSDPFFSQERSIEREERRKKSKKRGGNSGKLSPADGEVKSANESKEDARKRAELELLTMDDAVIDADNTGSMRAILAAAESDDDSDKGKSRRGKRIRGKRRGRRDVAEKNAIPEPSAMDIKDPRFQGLFDSHLFAMDPTHPKFRDNETTQKILKEKMRRTKTGTDTHGGAKADVANGASESPQIRGERDDKANTANSELRQLAARVKARAKVSARKNRKR